MQRHVPHLLLALLLGLTPSVNILFALIMILPVALLYIALGLLFGSVLTFAYSAAGAGLSLAVMALLKRADKFTPVGVSIAGGVLHNAGQIIMAILIMKNF